jgi:hypothetical protein
MPVLQVLIGLQSKGTLARWRRYGMTAEAASRAARFLEGRVAVEMALVAELDAYAAKRATERQPRYFARMPVDERRRLAAMARAKREAANRASRSSGEEEL